MKKKIFLIFPIICILLAIALVVSVFQIRSAKSDVKELEKQIAELAEENQQLESINLALQIQVDSLTGTSSGFPGVSSDSSYCALFLDSWNLKNNVLTAEGLAQAVFDEHTDFTAKIEIWKNDEVLSSQDISLTTGGADPVYEAAVSVAFEIPELAPEEELELWLMVAPETGTPMFACGAGWYLENGQMMIVAG